METPLRPSRMWERSVAFTLVELMIVVVIVAILVMVAVPVYRSNAAQAKMSEAIAGVGTVRTAMRIYAAFHNGDYPVLTAVDGSGLGVINVTPSSLDGKYFDRSNYEVTSTVGGYKVKAVEPLSGMKYEIDHSGIETTGTGYYTSGY